MVELISDDIDFSKYLVETENSAKVKNAKDYAYALKDRLRAKQKKTLIYLPWDKVQNNFDFRAGEVTVWAGQNGHGKSLVTSQIALSLIGQDQKVAIASFEMLPVMTLQRMARMFCATNPFSPEYQNEDGLKALDSLYDDFLGWADGKLFIYDQTGSVHTDKVIGMVRYCAQELKVSHVFIDNLAKVVKSPDDYAGQKYFIDNMTSIAKDYGIHIHVVHHLRKPPKETERPDKHDVKGAGEVVDLIDNLFLVWRNKEKEEDRKTGQNKLSDDPDQIIFCRKNRNHEGIGDGEPTILLWHHVDSGQFLESPTSEVMWFPNYPHKLTEY